MGVATIILKVKLIVYKTGRQVMSKKEKCKDLPVFTLPEQKLFLS